MADNTLSQPACDPHIFTPPTEHRGLLENMRSALSETIAKVENFAGAREDKTLPEASSLHGIPHFLSGTMSIRYGDEDREVGPGFRQSGVITSVKDGILTQNTGRTTVQYSVDDLIGDARPGYREAMEEMFVPGRNIAISVGPHNVHVASNDLECAQQHAVEQAR